MDFEYDEQATQRVIDDWNSEGEAGAFVPETPRRDELEFMDMDQEMANAMFDANFFDELMAHEDARAAEALKAMHDEGHREPPKQSVRWAFTWHKPDGMPTEGFFNKMRKHFEYLTMQSGVLRYVVAGLEQAPTTEKWHLQGYMEFPTGKKLRTQGVTRTIKYDDMGKPHVEGAVASGKVNRVYCLKLGTANPNAQWFEFGTLGKNPGETMKASFEDTLEMARRGEFSAISASHQVQYWGNIQKIHFSTHENLQDDPEFLNFWIVGLPGVGKSRCARDMAQGLPTYFKDAGNKWFDDYHKEPVVILDDLEKDAKYQAHLLKMIADRYPCRVEIKGASTLIRPKMIIVTSNYFIEDIFEDIAVRNAIGRRFRTIHLEHYDPADITRISTSPLNTVTTITAPPGSAANPLIVF